MIKRTIVLSLMGCVFLCISLSFTDAQVSGGKASTNKPDPMLFEQAQKALSKSNFAEARTLLYKLINNYPESGYLARAKLSIGDSWYSEHAFKQAESEYRDFVTFFPDSPDVAKAQSRINSIEKSTMRQPRDER